MPTPSAPGVIRAQCILQGKTGKPEDRFVTTFHFVTPSGSADELHFEDAASRLTDFWTAAASNGEKIIDYLGAQVVRGPDALEFRMYHLGDPELRIPTIRYATILGTAPSQSFPAEVAVCASFSGPQPLPRKRGRVYIGPLAVGSSTEEATTGRRRVGASVMLTIVDRMQALSTNTPTTPAQWAVYSPTNNETTLVTRGYVDDAFDTQRRRGLDSINRTAFITP